jgi:L-erythro-3,5-diaminohexanoate dehydrogenase
MKKGCKFGTHRVIEPKGVLPQTADVVSNDIELYDNEILIDVDSLNIDSASFRQLHEEAHGDVEKIKSRILAIVEKAGKMKNPVTGSGGVLIGKVERIGEALANKTDLKVGDKIVTLVSLSLTPLKIDKIMDIYLDTDRVDIKGKAILFESGLYAKIPSDIPEEIAMAALDVAGAPAQTAKLVKEGHRVLVFGAGGKSGILCCYEAKKRVGPNGLVVGIEWNDNNIKRLKELEFCDVVIKVDAQNPVDVMDKALEASQGKEYDISINCLNVPNCEMSCILPVKNDGIVYLFSMATSFTKAALGAEGVGKDISMIIGNGYTKGHGELTLQDLRESPELMKLFKDVYVGR